MTNPLAETNRQIVDDVRARVRVLAQFIERLDDRITRQDEQMLRIVRILKQRSLTVEPGTECPRCGYVRTVWSVCPRGCDTSPLMRRRT